MSEAIRTVVSILTGIIGLAILVALISKNSNTAGVIGAVTGGLAQDIAAADAPITGGGGFGGAGFSPSAFGGYPGSGGMLI